MISVIIPTYSRPQKIIDAVKSVQNQTYKDIEILIVDDNGIGSENQIETQKVVSSINDARIKYITHETNKGGCAARNTGIKNATGEFVAFLDDDDVWSDKFLETMLKYYDDDKIGAVYCDFYSYDGFYSITAKNPHYYEGFVKDKILAGWCPASTSLFIVKKDSIIDAGMFDEKLPSFQDYDMWLRLSEKYEFKFCPEKLVLKYEGIGEQASKNPKRRVSGFNLVVQKYECILTESELELFSRFKESYYYDTLFRCIVYNQKNGLPYKKEKKEYLKHYNSFGVRLHLFLKLHIKESLYKKIGRFFNKFKGQMIYYKGPYPV